ncbi:MAG TPA: DUF1428 domain-containing protein [Gemmatimonadaceae bacterium]|nr:DUF1428 domain-containing protein [Gemmatimonadaceae bacterium]
MARYVDGFLIPIPKKNVKRYQSIARAAGRIWREYGALEYVECVGDDVSMKGSPASFPRRVRAKPNEAVVFSWIVYRSKAHRDRVNKKIMKDPRILKMMERQENPFDPKKMSYGGFEVLVEA